MAKACPVCQHPDVADINIKCLEGVGNQAISQEYGLSRAAVENHRKAGHASRELTKAVIQGHQGPLSELHNIFIASKVNRVRRLNDMMELVWTALDRDRDKPNAALVRAGKDLLESAAKEMGEWRPDGGEKADATIQLAQSIVIHAAVQAKLNTPTLASDSGKSSESENE